MPTPRHDDSPALPPPTAPRRGQAAFAVVLVVGAFFLMVLVWPFAAAALFFRGVDEGRALDVPAAQALLAARPADFAAVRALAMAAATDAGAQRAAGDADQRARLAQQLQALDVRTESLDGQATAVVVFARFGLPEIYDLRLQWLPPALDAAAHAGRRLGEHQDALGDGWWRVVH